MYSAGEGGGYAQACAVRDVLAWETRQGLLFQAMMNRYMIGTNEAVVL